MIQRGDGGALAVCVKKGECEGAWDQWLGR